jgi:steroid delta-isomerase-like uncharacterized protein
MPDLAGAEPIESPGWLRRFADRYGEAWNSHDPGAVSACLAEDVVFEDPTLSAPARGRDEVVAFAVETFEGFPDVNVETTQDLTISEDRLRAFAPWRMTGTNTGPIDPPGFAPTGRSFEIEGVGLWSFRGGLLWRYRDLYDTAELARQLGLLPPRGGAGEKLMVRMQRLRAGLARRGPTRRGP